jgi:hypothetical protein
LNEALQHFRESSDRFPVISRSAITWISRASATKNQRYPNRYRPHTFSVTVRTETRPRPPESRPSKVGHKPFTLTYSCSLGKFSFLHVQSELGAIHGDHNISSSCSTESKWFVNQNQKTYEKTLKFATKSKQNHDGVFRILIHIIPMRIINRSDLRRGRLDEGLETIRIGMTKGIKLKVKGSDFRIEMTRSIQQTLPRLKELQQAKLLSKKTDFIYYGLDRRKRKANRDGRL